MSKLRKVTERDRQTLKKLDQFTFDETYGNSFYSKFISHGCSFVFEDDNSNIIGYIEAKYYPSKKSDNILIYSLGVSEEHRGKGIAQKLLAAVLKVATEDACVYLNVRPSNAAAMHIYEKAGFTIDAEVKSYYNDGESCYDMVFTKAKTINV